MKPFELDTGNADARNKCHPSGFFPVNSDTMTIFVNNSPFPFDKVPTLSSILDAMKINNPHGIAVAVNEQVVPKSEWEKLTLKNNDKIILIKATAGG